jgi:sugar lactone lactonase YvrE
MQNWQQFTAIAHGLAESPFWHPQEQKLYWVDIVAKTICRTDMRGAWVEQWHLPSEPGCIAPRQGGGLVMALRSGVFTAPTWKGALQHIATLPYDPGLVRANDGKCDGRGRFWVGTVDETKCQQRAGLYCIDATGPAVQVHCVLSDATTANGLAWSPDQATLYWADTAEHQVWQWQFEVDTATLSHKKNFLQWPVKPHGWEPLQAGYGGRPDGATVDRQGNYYVAMYEGGCVEQWSAQGTMLARYATPVPCPTMPCFGGHDLKTLFVTTARHGRSSSELSQHPNAGAVFYRQAGIPGVPVDSFVMQV